MLDFKKLRDPVYRAEQAERRKREAAEEALRDERLLAERSAAIAALVPLMPTLKEWDASFVDSMRRLSERVDLIRSVAGGELLDLSAPRLEQLERICKAATGKTIAEHYPSAASAPPADVEPERPQG